MDKKIKLIFLNSIAPSPLQMANAQLMETSLAIREQFSALDIKKQAGKHRPH
jgi:hypothetical protein